MGGDGNPDGGGMTSAVFALWGLRTKPSTSDNHGKKIMSIEVRE